MTQKLDFQNLDDEIVFSTVSPFKEMGAYEALWAEQGTTFKKLADKFKENPGSKPSDFVDDDLIAEFHGKVYELIKDSNVRRFNVRVHGDCGYSQKLRDAVSPVELLYFIGWWNYTESKSIAVIGSRKPSDAGIRRARKLVKQLVENDYTIVSGLAEGIDTVAHTTAIEQGGVTYAVIGTPITEVYPKKNASLQKYISKNFLLVSQVPIWKYYQQDYRYNKNFFRERNKTMSALSDATVIVEAAEKSGTLIQARAALEQGRKLFILESCFKNQNLTWPAKFFKQGAIRVSTIDDILENLHT